MSSFCGNSSLWTDEQLSASGPNFTDCFRNIVPVFIPVVWLILGMPFYIYNIIKRQRQQIPLTPLSIVKTVLCFVVAFLWLADISVNRSFGYRCDSFTDPPSIYYVCAVFHLLAVPKCINSIFHYVFFAVILVQLVLYSFTENLFKDEYEHIGKMECPETCSSVVSKILFWWYNPVVTMCYKKIITKEDLWDNLPCLKAEPVVAEIQASWRGEENRSTLDSRQFADKPTQNGHFKTGYYEIGKDSVNLQKYDHCQMINGHLNSSETVNNSNPSLNGTNCKQEPSFLKCVVKLYGYEWLRACFIQILSDTAMLLQPLILALNTKIRQGKLVAVVGLVGSGKSSLLSSILGEMEKLEGEVHVQGSVSYVSQEPWIQNLTIRDNILYGHEYVDRKYRKVIKNCCLRTDFKILPGGDETELGERGINVSGGQKQRINLARAVYSDSDIYLMDDPLSAVDSHVGKDLFDKVIGPNGMLKNKTRIFVTHGVQWLPKVDEIIVIDNGIISEHGTYERLVSNNGPFSRFLMQHLVDEDTSEDGDDTEFQKIKDEMFERVIVTSDGGMSDYITSDGVMSDDENKTQRSRSRRTLARQNSRKLKRQLSKDCGSPDKQESQTAKPQKDGLLVQDETSEKGSVKLAVILTYIKSMGVLITIMAFIFLCVYQGLGIYSNIWITYWTSNLYLLNVSNWNTDFYYEEKTYYLGFYALIGILQGISFILFQGFIVNGFIHGTNRFHSKVLSSILRSPMSFFDTTPTGRIINRFSGDIDILDDRFPRICNFFVISLSTLIATMIVIVMKTPLVMVVIVPVAVLYVVIIKFYLPTSRQLKRTEAVTRSLLLSHYSETINGTSVIRAYNSEERFIDEVYKRLDLNSSFYFAANTGMGWIGMRIQTFGNLVVLAAALFAVLSTSLSGADAGLSLTYALQIIVSMNAVVQTVSILQMDIISMERVDEYSKLQPEATWIGNKRPVDDWPANGEIEFLNYKTCYREGLDLVLRGVSCNIKPGEKIGVVGRTGAGKSSLTMALYRLIERVDGCIKIDGLDIAAIGLHDLRSKISILPQDPVIFSESLRTNLDPSSKFTDAQIWKALEYSNLKSFITSQYADLRSEVGESGRDLRFVYIHQVIDNQYY
ncbi:Hypothetical predicted protein [Mytilus galloprovincialis]|uniref:Uncharacterized protein n=1 Tax=Mytilus galloprovincialis TaxID=29158 RepID=A0A8B6DNW5_MYTGA|nr:Hypothetical predicted protein [Mytilus galloprovincialis]